MALDSLVPCCKLLAKSFLHMPAVCQVYHHTTSTTSVPHAHHLYVLLPCLHVWMQMLGSVRSLLVPGQLPRLAAQLGRHAVQVLPGLVAQGTTGQGAKGQVGVTCWDMLMWA